MGQDVSLQGCDEGETHKEGPQMLLELVGK
jgi:hypothetical protein